MFSESKFIIDGIKQGLRCDGRSPLKSRVVQVSKNTELLAAGSSQLNIELYSPHIICGLKTEISSVPDISLSIEPAGKSTSFAREKFKEITDILNDLIIQHLNKSQLQIIPEKKYWKIFIDVLVIDQTAGNLIEQISLSILLALKDADIITVVGYLNKNSLEEFLQIQNEVWKLDVTGFPVVISVSFACGVVVLDLCPFEEECVDITLHIAVDSSGSIRGMVKQNSGTLDFKQVTQAISIARSAATQIFSSLSNEIIQYSI
jgi:exosome complex RNA-binding protein Rrp42 (RNase PH superfamily)